MMVPVFKAVAGGRAYFLLNLLSYIFYLLQQKINTILPLLHIFRAKILYFILVSR